ncbi:MAG: hypothetical protein U9N52_02530 [Campylobacterota bacterium]|nr:hypothetical protein [Campylobacterota bacterium]
MTQLRHILITLLALCTLILFLLLTPKTNKLILVKLTTHLLHVKSSFVYPHISWNRYHIKGTLDAKHHIALEANYERFSTLNVRLDFDGDIHLFSKLAGTELPKIKTKLKALLDHDHQITAEAELLEGTLLAWFDSDLMQYKAHATELSLSSYLSQQEMEAFAKGEIELYSEGVVSDIIDLNVSLNSHQVQLLSPSLELIGETNNSSAPIDLNVFLTLQNRQLHSTIDMNSSLAKIERSEMAYNLTHGYFDITAAVQNKMAKYPQVKSLHVKTSGHYLDGNVSSKVYLDADGYKLDLEPFNYIENYLRVSYSLHSKNQEFADISSDHPLHGHVSYVKDVLDANITSLLLADTINIHLKDKFLQLKTDALSLSGLLEHLKQEDLASARLSLQADVELSEEMQWIASLDTQDLLLEQSLQKMLGNDDTISLHVKAFSDVHTIIINPQIISSMFNLEASQLVYNTLENLLHVKGDFNDINLSHYHSPSLALQSDINLSEPLHVKMQLHSPYEDIDLELSKNSNKTEVQLLFDFNTINRLALAKDVHSLHGKINATQSDKTVKFNSILNDINTTFYTTKYAVISGDIAQDKAVKGHVNLKTMYEELSLDLNHEANESQMTFSYDLQRLDRFATLNPDYNLSGSGALSAINQTVQIDLDSKQFGHITLDKQDENLRVQAEAIAIRELFEFSNQKAVVDGDLKLSATMTPSALALSIDSKEIRPLDENLSLRPTALHAKVNLDRNHTQYRGIAEIITDHEHFTCKDIELRTAPLYFRTDFVLSSDDLQKGTPILPDTMIGETHFDGNISYSDSLLINVKNPKLIFNERLHKTFDANATGNVSIAMSTDLSFIGQKLNLNTRVSSPYFDLNTFKTFVDLNTSHLQSSLDLKTDLWQKDTQAKISMNYANPMHLDAQIHTAYETLHINDINLNTQNQEVNGSYRLVFRQTQKDDLFVHGVAEFEGELYNQPKPEITLNTQSFGGDFNLVATQEELNIKAKSLLAEKILQFADINSSLKSGNIDFRATLKDENFLELNTSTIKADISFNATNLLLYGINADKEINTLKNYQDINIFEGNFPGRSIVSSIVTAPIDLVSDQKVVMSVVEQVHADSYIEDGRFYCYDCVLKTAQNRIAIKGAIDLNTTDFQYFRVGLLQNNDCAFFTQQIKGSIKNPKIGLAKTSLKLIYGTVKSVGGVLKDGINLGTSLISKTGEYTSKAIDVSTGYIPVVNKATGAVSETITRIADAPEQTNEWASRACTPFYRGVVRPSDAND